MLPRLDICLLSFYDFFSCIAFLFSLNKSTVKLFRPARNSPPILFIFAYLSLPPSLLSLHPPHLFTCAKTPVIFGACLYLSLESTRSETRVHGGKSKCRSSPQRMAVCTSYLFGRQRNSVGLVFFDLEFFKPKFRWKQKHNSFNTERFFQAISKHVFSILVTMTTMDGIETTTWKPCVPLRSYSF